MSPSLSSLTFPEVQPLLLIKKKLGQFKVKIKKKLGQFKIHGQKDSKNKPKQVEKS